MKFRVSALTDVGRRRTENEDYFCVDETLGLFIVADGMGGHASGEVASKMATELVRDAFERAKGGEAPLPSPANSPEKRLSEEAKLLAEAIRFANQMVFDTARDNPQHKGMGTTIVAVLIEGERMTVAHVGDSRLYLVRGNCVEQLTDDHALLAEQVREGLISQEEADRSNMKNIITRSIGVTPEVEADLDEMTLSDGDRLVLCSDGVTSLLDEDDFHSIVTAGGTPADACKKLVDRANDLGGTDNITVITVDIYKSALSGLFSRAGKLLR